MDSSHGSQSHGYIPSSVRQYNGCVITHACTRDLTKGTRDLSNTRFPGLVYLKNAEIKILTTRITNFAAHENEFLACSLVQSIVGSLVRSFVVRRSSFVIRSFVGSSTFRTRRNPERARFSKRPKFSNATSDDLPPVTRST